MKRNVVLTSLLLLVLAGPAAADSHMSGDTMSGDRPTRGMSDSRVAAEFGQPMTRVDAVGEPPISRWEYADFIVYFEYDRVIHAVTRRQ